MTRIEEIEAQLKAIREARERTASNALAAAVRLKVIQQEMERLKYANAHDMSVNTVTDSMVAKEKTLQRHARYVLVK